MPLSPNRNKSNKSNIATTTIGERSSKFIEIKIDISEGKKKTAGEKLTNRTVFRETKTKKRKKDKSTTTKQIKLNKFFF